MSCTVTPSSSLSSLHVITKTDQVSILQRRLPKGNPKYTNTAKIGTIIFLIWLVSLHFLVSGLARLLKKYSQRLMSFQLQGCSVLSFWFNLNFCSAIYKQSTSTIWQNSVTQIFGLGTLGFTILSSERKPKEQRNNK